MNKIIRYVFLFFLQLLTTMITFIVCLEVIYARNIIFEFKKSLIFYPILCTPCNIIWNYRLQRQEMYAVGLFNRQKSSLLYFLEENGEKVCGLSAVGQQFCLLFVRKRQCYAQMLLKSIVTTIWKNLKKVPTHGTSILPR